MFNSYLCTFLNIFQANFAVKYKNTSNKKNYLITQGIKNLANVRGACTPLLNTTALQKQKDFTLSIVESYKKFIKEAKKQHCGRLAEYNN